MKRQTAFVAKFLKKYESVCPGITDSWYSNDVQKKFHSFKSKKCCTHECVTDESTSTQKYTCFIMYCNDKRKILQQQNPHVPNTQITSMLAKEWREHKRLAEEDKTLDKTSDENVYNKYKNMYQKMVFFDKHKHVVKESYPELDEKDLQLALEKLYIKYINQK